MLLHLRLLITHYKAGARTKQTQEVYQSDLQALNIRLVHFLGIFNMRRPRNKVLNLLQWQSIETLVCPFFYNGSLFILLE